MPTRFPGVRLKPLGHPSRKLSNPSTEEQGFVLEPRSGESPLQPRCKGTGENPTVHPTCSTEEQGFEPWWVFPPNALAGRRL